MQGEDTLKKKEKLEKEGILKMRREAGYHPSARRRKVEVADQKEKQHDFESMQKERSKHSQPI